MLKSKIHRATVTEANLNYQGSITIDQLLMKKADILPGEKVEVFNLNNGYRLETYTIKGQAGSGVICINGPASHHANVGDIIMILSYILIDDKDAPSVKAKIVKVDERNRIKD
jgi:aspartate 1-decarboxylase